MLATVALDGAPSARVVVLRTVDSAAGHLWVHSDVRAAKVAEIAADPRVALTFHDPGDALRAPLQLRVSGVATCERTPSLLAAAWARVPALSRRNYQSVLAPGTPLPEGGADVASEADDGRHFAVLRVEARRLEWLWLGERHCRGVFWRDGDWHAQALVT